MHKPGVLITYRNTLYQNVCPLEKMLLPTAPQSRLLKIKILSFLMNESKGHFQRCTKLAILLSFLNESLSGKLGYTWVQYLLVVHSSILLGHGSETTHQSLWVPCCHRGHWYSLFASISDPCPCVLYVASMLVVHEKCWDLPVSNF